MRILFITLFCLSFLTMQAQHQKTKDTETIKSMCGCYEVSFNFAETFAPDKDYEYHDNYTSGALEYVFPISDTKDKIVLQHLLVIGDTMIIKHWRQDWIYENTDFYMYEKESNWSYVHKKKDEVDGQWTQKVYQVDDGPRYEGSATWIHADGRNYWENTTFAPLPRRERKRDDYNIMERRNRHEITREGWIHEQDNQKINRTAQNDVLIAREKGWNTYLKTDESHCAIAKKWWEKHAAYWHDVRAVWDELFAQHQDITLKDKVDGQKLFMRLFALQDQLTAESYHSDVAQKEIKHAIQLHLSTDIGWASR